MVENVPKNLNTKVVTCDGKICRIHSVNNSSKTDDHVYHNRSRHDSQEHFRLSNHIHHNRLRRDIQPKHPVMNFLNPTRQTRDAVNNNMNKIAPTIINNYTSTHKKKYYTVIGSKQCKFCIQTLELLNANDLGYTYLPFDTIKDDLKLLKCLNDSNIEYTRVNFKQEYLTVLKSIPEKHTTLPIIWANNDFIGGYSELNDIFTTV